MTDDSTASTSANKNTLRRVHFHQNVVAEIHVIEAVDQESKRNLFYVPEDFIRFRRERNLEALSEQRALQARLNGRRLREEAAETLQVVDRLNKRQRTATHYVQRGPAISCKMAQAA